MDKKQIEHMAKLSRLDISDIENLNTSISNVINMMNDLQTLDLSDMHADTSADIKNSFREDIVINDFNIEMLRQNAPEFEAGGISVPKVVE